MKKIIYGLFGFAALFTSCDYHDLNDGNFNVDKEAGYVTFLSDGETEIGFDPAVETNFEVSVPVVLRSVSEDILFTNVPVNESGLKVYYTVEDISGSSSFVVKSGSVFLPKGALTANIPFTIPANATGAGCSDFVITLDSANRNNVTVGNEGVGILTHTVHVGPASRDLLVGTYNVEQDSGGIESQYTVTITPGEEANEFVIHNLFNRGNNTNTIAYIDSVGQISSPVDYNENFLFNAGAQGDVFVANVNGIAYCNNIDIKFTLKTTAGDIQVSTLMTKQ